MKILHLEDNEHDAALIGEALSGLQAPHQITRVATRSDFSNALAGGGWDILLADYALPSFDGISALKLAAESCPETPFVFVTGTLGEERAVEALKNGATDHVLKHRLDRLPQVVARAIQECESVQARKGAEQATRISLCKAEFLLHEVHHRVNNNFQMICSLLNLQAGAVADPLLASSLQQSLNRIRSMARAHAMLYAAGNLQDIDFAEYVRTIAADIQYTCGADPAPNGSPAIHLTLNLSPVRLGIDQAVPCGLILNELLSNAFRHAFPNGKGGEICVSLSRAESDVLLAVEDSGAGLAEGFRLAEVQSAGFSIINILTRQLRGTLEASSGPGARFDLRFA